MRICSIFFCTKPYSLDYYNIEWCVPTKHVKDEVGYGFVISCFVEDESILRFYSFFCLLQRTVNFGNDNKGKKEQKSPKRKIILKFRLKKGQMLEGRGRGRRMETKRKGRYYLGYIFCHNRDVWLFVGLCRRLHKKCVIFCNQYKHFCQIVEKLFLWETFDVKNCTHINNNNHFHIESNFDTKKNDVPRENILLFDLCGKKMEKISISTSILLFFIINTEMESYHVAWSHRTTKSKKITMIIKCDSLWLCARSKFSVRSFDSHKKK